MWLLKHTGLEQIYTYEAKYISNFLKCGAHMIVEQPSQRPYFFQHGCVLHNIILAPNIGDVFCLTYMSKSVLDRFAVDPTSFKQLSRTSNCLVYNKGCLINIVEQRNWLINDVAQETIEICRSELAWILNRYRYFEIKKNTSRAEKHFTKHRLHIFGQFCI